MNNWLIFACPELPSEEAARPAISYAFMSKQAKLAPQIEVGASPSLFRTAFSTCGLFGLISSASSSLPFRQKQSKHSSKGLVSSLMSERDGVRKALGFFPGPGDAQTVQDLDYLLLGSAPKLEDEKRITVELLSQEIIDGSYVLAGVGPIRT